MSKIKWYRPVFLAKYHAFNEGDRSLCNFVLKPSNVTDEKHHKADRCANCHLSVEELKNEPSEGV